MSDLTFDEIREKLNKVLRFGVFTTNAEQYVTGLFEVVIQRAEAAEARVAELEFTQRGLLEQVEYHRVHALDAEIEAQRLRAELDALKAAQQWQPVDTAPIDRPLEALLTARRSADDRWYYADVRPTAWRPLPPAPNEAEEVQP